MYRAAGLLVAAAAATSVSDGTHVPARAAVCRVEEVGRHAKGWRGGCAYDKGCGAQAVGSSQQQGWVLYRAAEWVKVEPGCAVCMHLHHRQSQLIQ